jgi:site-specific recombinase XerD
MRQVIRRFSKASRCEKNASVTTIKSYNTISINSTCIWLNDWETDSFPEMSPTSLHCKGREVNILPLDDSAMIELRAYVKQRRRRNRTRALFISSRNRRISRETVWYLVKRYLKNPNQDSQDGTARFAPHLCDIAIKPGRESKSHSESMNHKSLATTARYLHSRNQKLVKAVNGLKLLGG